MAFTDLLIHTAALLKKTYGSGNTATDKHGQRIFTYVEESDPLICRIHPVSSSNRTIAGGDISAITMTHRLYCAADETIAARDRVTLSGKTYEVLSVSDTSGMSHHLQADLVEVNP